MPAANFIVKIAEGSGLTSEEILKMHVLRGGRLALCVRNTAGLRFFTAGFEHVAEGVGFEPTRPFRA